MVMATICEELPPDSVMLVYLSASGHGALSPSSNELNSGMLESLNNGKRESRCHHDNYLWYGSKGNAGSNNLYPGNLISFTRIAAMHSRQ
ncbi:hypothetical protein P8452_39447 [Trifolium repens]|nr:hypothetical protein P8452_39447 [Trifolium repens]